MIQNILEQDQREQQEEDELENIEQDQSWVSQMLDKIKLRTRAVEQNPLYLQPEWRQINKCIQEFYPTNEQVEEIKIESKKLLHQQNVLIFEFTLKPQQALGPYNLRQEITLKLNQQFSEDDAQELAKSFKINHKPMEQSFFIKQSELKVSQFLHIENDDIPLRIQILCEKIQEEL